MVHMVIKSGATIEEEEFHRNWAELLDFFNLETELEQKG